MRKIPFVSIMTATMALFLATAFAEDGKNANDTAPASVTTTEKSDDTGSQDISLMDQPVNFSTPEDVEKSLQNIREHEGEDAYKKLQYAMKYILYYDLGLAGKNENLYKILDGSTPAQILAKAKR